MGELTIGCFIIGYLLWASGRELKHKDYPHYLPFTVLGRKFLVFGVGSTIGLIIGLIIGEIIS